MNQLEDLSCPSNQNLSAKRGCAFESEGSPNRPALHAIITRYFASPVVCRNITNRLDSLEIGEHLLCNNLIKSTGPESRPNNNAKMQMLEDLRNANLFYFAIGKWKAITIVKGSAYIIH